MTAQRKANIMSKYGTVTDYTTARDIRPATSNELARSLDAAKYDGGCGVFLDADGTSVYVTGEDISEAERASLRRSIQ